MEDGGKRHYSEEEFQRNGSTIQEVRMERLQTLIWMLLMQMILIKMIWTGHLGLMDLMQMILMI